MRGNVSHGLRRKRYRAKLQELSNLKKRMRREFAPRELWFFESSRVAGYQGTEPIMFVGQRPSLGKGPSKKNTDRPGGFYSLLVEYGFKDAHITDLVKESMKTGSLWKEQVDENWPYFQAELEIIQPTIVVAIGGEVRGILKDRMVPEIPIEQMVHYAYRFKTRDWLERKMRADLARIRRKVDES